jgi:pimeloyl-ACP methyl ester carboxylesterase
MTDSWVTLDGLRTRYLEEGQGAPVVLLHGAAPGTSAEVWQPNLGPLAARGLRVLAPDLPGWGLTDAPADHSPGYRRDHVLRFMDALGIATATLVGHSMAGGMVTQLAFSRPDRVASMVILGTGTLLPPLGDKAPSAPVHNATHEPTLDDVRAELEANTFDHSWITPEVVKRRHELAIGKNFESLVAREALPRERADGPPIWERLDQVPVPALFVYGREDRGNAAARAELALQRFPRLNLHILDGCKHMVQWDKCAEVNELIAGFVLQTAPAGAR